MKRVVSCWQWSASAVIRLPSSAALGSLLSRGLIAGISLLFSWMGSWATVRRKRWLTAESNCSGLPSLRPLPQTFAIYRQALEDGNLLSHHPLSDAQVKFGGIQLVHHAEEGAVAGGTIAVGLGIFATAQGSQLPLSEFFAFILKSLVTTGSHEHGHRGTGQHEGLP